MVEYDPKIIYEFATRLYRTARTIIGVYAAVGVVVGGLGGALLDDRLSEGSHTWMIIGLVLVGLLGFAVGQEKAFTLKLQAQTALCQARIEENTRKQ